jgi:hypothetical protein
LIVIDLVLAEIQLIVDDVEDGRVQDFIDAEGAVVRIAAGFGGRKREMELRQVDSRRRKADPQRDQRDDRQNDKNDGCDQRNSPRRAQGPGDATELQLLLFFLRLNRLGLGGRMWFVVNVHRGEYSSGLAGAAFDSYGSTVSGFDLTILDKGR